VLNFFFRRSFKQLFFTNILRFKHIFLAHSTVAVLMPYILLSQTMRSPCFVHMFFSRAFTAAFAQLVRRYPRPLFLNFHGLSPFRRNMRLSAAQNLLLALVPAANAAALLPSSVAGASEMSFASLGLTHIFKRHRRFSYKINPRNRRSRYSS
jgi:hypothetical protein